MDAKSELRPLPDHQNIKLIHNLFRISSVEIEEPQIAPRVLFLDKFWDVFPKNITFTRLQERYLGFDARNGILECTEIAYGGEGTVKPKSSHLIDFHTEPYQSKNELNANKIPFIVPLHSDKEVAAHNFPRPYLPDIKDMLDHQGTYGEVVFRYGEKDEDPMTALVVLKSKQWKNKKAQLLWWELKHEMNYTPTRPFKYRLAEDEFITSKLGLVVYRGFVSMPPTKEEPLRLRAIANRVDEM